ncbi:DUF397 domain-containing protein [Actinomadura sp. KC216]|uniref:DUF397 domain-containing protein n=1 Tax=Actinomadura sp. KC216 TaxID=2530370 RepID=UPI001053347A|nr:DUF397 domain-containing protein [Actinomadura sp. KC216]TDB90111.1 DUF397 domain-containing protein [Actinomadura sp. KC216]
MTNVDLSRAVWRKSRRSGNGGDCVEVADLGQGVAVRDSKAPPSGHLTLSAESFARLVARVKRDELDI